MYGQKRCTSSVCGIVYEYVSAYCTYLFAASCMSRRERACVRTCLRRRVCAASAYVLVSGVVYVRRRLLDEQRGELQQQNAHGVRRAERVVGIDDAVDEDADDVVVAVLVGRRRAADQRLTVAALEARREARDQDVL